MMNFTDHSATGTGRDIRPIATQEENKARRVLSTHEMLHIYLQEELTLPGKKLCMLYEMPGQSSADVPRWTDKKTGLIEILYSLDTLCCVECGEISLHRLQTHFEELFGIKLGNISRAFAEMRIRNNRTPFLDRMKAALLERMRSDEEPDKTKNKMKM